MNGSDRRFHRYILIKICRFDSVSLHFSIRSVSLCSCFQNALQFPKRLIIVSILVFISLFLIFISMKSKFFESSGGKESFDSVHYTNVHFVDDEGKHQVHCIETTDDPLSLLSFDDFSLSQMIKNGISYKSLNITPDMRLGHEKDFDALAKRFDSMSKQMFVESKTE